MQLNLAPAERAATTTAEQLVFAVLPNVIDPAAQQRAAAAQERFDQRERHRDAAARDRQADPRPADVMRAEQRRAAATRRAAQPQGTTGANSDPAAFRRALSDASSATGGKAPAAPSPPATPASSIPSGGETPPAQPRTPAQAPPAPATPSPLQEQRTPRPAAPASEPQMRLSADVAAAVAASRAATPASQALDPSATRAAVRAVEGASPARSGPTANLTQPASGNRTADPGAAAKRAAARNEPAESGKNDANVERILRSIRTQIGRDRSTAIIRLEPAELGTLRLRMDLHKDVLTVRAEAQTVAAQRLLSEHVAALRDGLEAAGIHLERIEIRPLELDAGPDHDDPSDNGDADASGSGASNEHRQPAADDPPDASLPPLETGTEAHTDQPRSSDPRGDDPTPASETLVNILA